MAGAFCALAAAGATAWAGIEELREVTAEELLANPKNYWSIGIMFKDTLTGRPTRREIAIGDRRYTEFATAKLGKCYASKDMLTKLEKLPLGREYLFTGTVLNRPSKLFGGASFHVVVRNATEAVSDDKNLKGGVLDAALKLPVVSPEKSATSLANVFSSVHAALFVYAEQRKIEFSDLFAPDSEHAAKVMDTVHSVLLSIQRESHVTANEILSQFVRDTLARYYAPATAGAAKGAPAQEQPKIVIDLKPGIRAAPPAPGKPAPAPAPESTVDGPAAAPAPAPEPDAQEAPTPSADLDELPADGVIEIPLSFDLPVIR